MGAAMNLLELAHLACDAAVKAGADLADVVVSSGRGVKVTIEKNGIHDVRETRSASISVRAIVKGARAFASSTQIDPEHVKDIARRAADAAKLAEPDPDFVTLPGRAQYEVIAGLWDDRVAKVSVGDMIQTVAAEVDGARALDDRAVVEAGASLGESESVIVNSLGVEASSRSTSINSSYSVVIREGDDVGSYYDFDYAHGLDDYAPQGLGASTCRNALRLLGARSCKSGVMPVVAGPFAASSIFDSIAGAASAEHVQRRRSYLAGKLGEKIGPEFLTITDDAYIPAGMSSGEFDSEGAPRQRVAIVQDGVLSSWLHGSYTANKSGEANTGHGTRSGGVSSTNVNPALGTVTAEELIRGVKDGIYVERASLSPDLSSGEVSSTVDFGYRIENGELTYPLRNTMLGIGVFDMLTNMEAISSDYREEPGSIMPSALIRDVRVAGGE